MIQNLLIVSGVSLIIGFGAGWTTKDWHEDSKTLAAENQARADQANKEEKVETITEAHETEKEEARVLYRTVTKVVDRIVEKPVYLNQCIDEEGRAQINKVLE